MDESSGCLISWTTLVTVHFSFPLLIPVGEMVSHCDLGLRFPSDEWSCVYFHVLTERNVHSNPMPIFQWVVLLLSCNYSLYILGIISFAYIWFANIFFHSVDFFTFWQYWHMKPLKFDEVPIILSLAACGLDVIPKKPLCTLKAKTFPSVFFFFAHTMQLTGSQLPTQGLALGPREWNHRVPATGPPGKSHVFFYKFYSVSGNTWAFEQFEFTSVHRMVRESTSFSCHGPSIICWQ